MWREDPYEIMWDYYPGSIDARQLAWWGLEFPGTPVWRCYGCGKWLPTV